MGSNGTRISEGTRRFRLQPTRYVVGFEVPVAQGPVIRLFGLAWLDRERAGMGLLIPECRSVHTFGMRFPLDLVFLDADDFPVRICLEVPPGRIAYCRQAKSVLELVPGGEVGWPIP